MFSIAPIPNKRSLDTFTNVYSRMKYTIFCIHVYKLFTFFSQRKKKKEKMEDPSTVFKVEEATQRLECRDPTLKRLCFDSNFYEDEDVERVVDALIANPDVVTDVFLSENEFTNETGLKLAQYVAVSSTIEHLCLSCNHLTDSTCLALASALCVNTSLQNLYLMDNETENMLGVEIAFIQALRLNPLRPLRSTWKFYFNENDFPRLKAVADQQGHPSLQMMLICYIDNPTRIGRSPRVRSLN